MKKPTRTKKLRVAAETVRELQTEQLVAAAGGQRSREPTTTELCSEVNC